MESTIDTDIVFVINVPDQFKSLSVGTITTITVGAKEYNVVVEGVEHNDNQTALYLNKRD